MIVAINYANLKFKKTQKFNSATAIHKGGVDKVISYSPKDIDRSFRRRNRNILDKKRGNGYWLWKPYFIEKTLEGLNEGDYLVYLDSGAFYINDVRHLIQQMDKDAQDIMTYELPFKECWYTKRDIFLTMDCDEVQYTDTNQRMATMFIIKKTERSLQFVHDWLYYCQQGTIITDAPNRLGEKNYAGFVENRHDQSIFSVLSKKYEFQTYRDPSQFGRYPDVFWKTKRVKLTAVSTYPQVIAEHRKAEVDQYIFWKQMLFAYAPKWFVKFLDKYSSLYESDRNEKKIAVLTDNMPIKENAYGFGMYKVVNRLTAALGSSVDTVIVTDRNYCKDKVSSAIEDKVVLANKFYNIQESKLSDICFLLEIWKVIHELRKKRIRKIFIPLGADYKELRRAYLVSKVYHMSIGVYVVDDFIEYQRKIIGNMNDSGLESRVIKYLKEINTVFVISKGMQERIYELTGKKSVILPIPYNYKEKALMNEEKQLQIMYLGSINNLYVQGIRDVAEIIDKINNEKGLDIKLLFTYKTPGEVKRLIGSYKCISSRRIDKDDEMREEMKRSLLCVMPHSDNINLSVLQNTSFPSKLIEYMSSAHFIVIYGSEKNSAQQYFEENNLPQVIHGRNKNLLEKCIIKCIEEQPDYSKKYTNILKKHHSFNYIKEKVIWYM